MVAMPDSSKIGGLQCFMTVVIRRFPAGTCPCPDASDPEGERGRADFRRFMRLIG
jgi:hypothetical protein